MVVYLLLLILDCPAAINGPTYRAIGIATIFCSGAGRVSPDFPIGRTAAMPAT